MEGIKRRPWSAIALVGSAIWVALCIYEVWFRQKNTFDAGPGDFLKLVSVAEFAATGVVTLALLAWMIERIWPPAPRR